MNNPRMTATPEEVLNDWYRSTLSPNAIKLYEAVWLRMASRGATVVSLSNDDASRRARVTLQHLPAAQSELFNAGLLLMDPGTHTTQYTFVDEAEVQAL